VTAHDETVPVLIVGGGYAGLASALFLAHNGVRPLLVDRHPSVSIQGRARGINQRTMEIYRAVGVADLVNEAGQPFDDESGVVRCETIAGEWDWLLGDETREPLPGLTAAGFAMADQRSVEPILIDAARDRGAQIRQNTQCLSVAQDPGGVTALIEDRASGQRRTIRAGYAIAADGFGGTVRDQLGIARHGPGVTKHWVTAVVEADLSDIVTKRAMFWIVVNSRIGVASFLSTSVPTQWAVSVTHDPAREPAASFTPQRCAEVARDVIGCNVPVRVLDVAAWTEAVGVAERYRSGRVFLAGDSAHVWPAAGAMGANSAVQDAHNLAWKLAAMLRGQAADALLDSYEAERRPLALTLADLTTRRQAARFGDNPGDDELDDTLCILGQRYRSGAVIGAAHEGVFGDQVQQHARPGTRAPHLWLRRDGPRHDPGDGGTDGEWFGVHDLFSAAFVLLTGPAGTGWLDAARTVAARAGIPLRAYRVGPAGQAELTDVEASWLRRYQAGQDDAVLIRPDGYVAWRSSPNSTRNGSFPGHSSPRDDRAGLLAGVLHQILGTNG
jgi:2-polyprenyl-6-methoxyphenol hydroxylase-like FAD-dependent oxidoreductase